jgi:hypothetical protein
MGKIWESLKEDQVEFIQKQKIFFVATAPKSGRINLSPKGMDSFRVINHNKVIWLNYTGSGNETAAHLLEDPRMTVMFCSFEEKPLILRLYGTAKAVHPRDAGWAQLALLFPDKAGARQFFEMDVDLVHTSCGESIPFYDYVGERDDLKDWFLKKGETGIADYWRDRNSLSLDEKPTGILGDI